MTDALKIAQDRITELEQKLREAKEATKLALDEAVVQAVQRYDKPTSDTIDLNAGFGYHLRRGYRVVCEKRHGQTIYEIREVAYGGEANAEVRRVSPISATARFVPTHDAGDAKAHLRASVQKLMDALELPIVDAASFGPMAEPKGTYEKAQACPVNGACRVDFVDRSESATRWTQYCWCGNQRAAYEELGELVQGQWHTPLRVLFWRWRLRNRPEALRARISGSFSSMNWNPTPTLSEQMLPPKTRERMGLKP